MAQHQPPDQETARIIADSLYQRDRMRYAFDIACDGAGIEVRQAITLIQLYVQEDPTISYLMHRMFRTDSTIAALLNHLQEKGYITREKDGKVVIPRLTEAGRHKAKDLISAQIAIYRYCGPEAWEVVGRAIDTSILHGTQKEKEEEEETN